MIELHGVIVIDKPAGLTSAAVVARVKKMLGARSVGHTGTLDPMATGVLPIVLGEGTKLAAFLLADDKEYECELELGYTTDTLDREGQVVARAPAEAVAAVTEPQLRAALAAKLGPQQQIPPMYSALKQDGQRLYDLARKGIEVERQPRAIEIDRLELTGPFTSPRARFVVACSKGTYVRSLVRDVGEALGCGATLTELRRTRAGSFALSHAVPLDPELVAQAAVVSPPDALGHLPAIQLDAAGTLGVSHGKPQAAPDGAPPGAHYRLLTPDGALAAVCEVKDGRFQYLRVFNYGLAR